MALKTEFVSLSRELTPAEQKFLAGLGQKFSKHEPIGPLLRRAFFAMVGESKAGRTDMAPQLTVQEREILQHYIRHPEQLKLLESFPVRTQPYVLVAALYDHYLARNDGRLNVTRFSTGPRRRLANYPASAS